MDGDDTREGDALLQTLVRRGDVLERVLSGVTDKPSLVEELDVSRSTVDRAVRELSGSGLLARDGGTVRATQYGRVAARAFGCLRGRLGDIDRARPILEQVPPEVALSPDALDGADIVSGGESTPYETLERLEEDLASADAAYSVVGNVLDSRGLDTFSRFIVEDGLHYEAVYTGEVVRLFRERRRDELETMVATGRYRVFELEGTPIRYTLVVTESEDGGSLCLVPDFGNGEVGGSLFNDAPAAVEWGRETVESYRDCATEITDEF